VRRAYSYVRFSTPEQSQGDSARRQIALSKEYCLKNDLSLDTRLNFRDEVSAFKGKNKQGALGDFLRLAQRGDIPRDSVLLVESLDRISREKPRKALRTLESIVDTGIEVVTLFDKRRHTVDTLDDFTGLLGSLMIMERANEESTTKARRLREVWNEKRKSGKPFGAICPGWLKLDKDAGIYVRIPDRAQLVKRIFKMTLSGFGKRRIAMTFNAEGITTWGRGKRKGRGWHDSYIQKILHNEAVIGVFYPHIIQDGKRTNLNTPVKGYFPAVMSEVDFRRVQAMSKKATPGRTVKVSNLFTNLCFDGYNPQAVMRFVDKGTAKRGNGKWKYLVSDAQRIGAQHMIARTRYDDFEQMFLTDLDSEHLDLHEIFKDDPIIDNAAIEKVQGEMNETSVAISRLTTAIEQGDAPDALLIRMRELEAKRDKQATELVELRERRVEFEGLEAGFDREWKRFDELMEAKTVDARLAIRQHIRRFVKRIELFPNGVGERSAEWEHCNTDNDRIDFAYSVEYINCERRLFVHHAPDHFSMHWPVGWSEKVRKKINMLLNTKL